MCSQGHQRSLLIASIRAFNRSASSRDLCPHPALYILDWMVARHGQSNCSAHLRYCAMGGGVPGAGNRAEEPAIPRSVRTATSWRAWRTDRQSHAFPMAHHRQGFVVDRATAITHPACVKDPLEYPRDTQKIVDFSFLGLSPKASVMAFLGDYKVDEPSR
jgi:hypothetical protein